MIASDLNFQITLGPDADQPYAQSVAEHLGRTIIECLINQASVTPTLLTIINEELKLAFESLRAMKKVFRYFIQCDSKNNDLVTAAKGFVIVNVQFARYETDGLTSVRITNFPLDTKI